MREVHVDAVVTDREGAPVADLGMDDFKVRVDGKKVRVTGLLNGEELRQTAAGRLTVIVLLDERHLREAHREEVLADVEEALVRELREHPTWVAVAALSDGLDPVLPPTRDVADLRDAFFELRSRDPWSTDLVDQQRRVTVELRDMLRSLAGGGSAYRIAENAKNSVLGNLEGYGDALADDTRETLGHVGTLVDGLAFMPGRKAILFVSDGVPRHPLAVVGKTLYDRLAGGARQYSGDDLLKGGVGDMVNDRNARPTGSDRMVQRTLVQEDDGGAMEFQRVVAELDCGPLFDRVAALANTHRATFYPLKPPVVDSGLSGLGERESERGSITALSDLRGGLDSLAGATGGLSFDSQNGVAEFLEQTRTDMAAYYSLSFNSPDDRGSAIREVTLRLRGREREARYRTSFLSLRMEQALSSQAWGSLLFGWEDNPHRLLVESRVGDLQGELHGIDLLFSVPIGAMDLVSDGTLAAGRFRLVMQLVGDEGDRLEPKHLAFDVQVPAADLEKASQQYFAVRSELHVRPGRYRMAVGLWEENTGQSTFLIEEIEAGISSEPEA
ncbi:MAG: VWA domain-containing protein [Acidobacteriota bacterium]